PIFKNLTTEDGLSFNTVYSIHEDKQGFIWIGTLDGLNRYDGNEFKNYRFIDPRFYQMVGRIVEDSLGNLWSGNILLKYHSETDKQQLLWKNENGRLEWAVGIDDILTGADNKLYMAGNNQIYTAEIYSEDSVIHKLFIKDNSHLFSRINKINFDHDQKLWLGTDQGLFYFDPISKDLLEFKPGITDNQKFIHDFIFDIEGNLWVVFTNYLREYNFSLNNFRDYHIQSLDNAVLTAIYQTRNGIIWIGTREQGLYYLDKEHDKFSCLLEDKSILTVFEDRSNRLWVGTDNSGIFMFDSLRNYFKALPLTINNKQVFSFYANKIIKAEDNGLWIGTSGYGLIYYSLATGKTSLVDSENNQVNMLYKDSNGKLWYDYLNYLVCYDPVKKTLRMVRHPVPAQFPLLNFGNGLNEMISFNDFLIMDSDYGQVYRYDPSDDKFTLIFEKKHFPIRSMLVNNDELVIAVYGTGLVVMDKTFTIRDTITQDAEEPGLIAHSIAALYKDSFDTLWVAGFGGLSKLNPVSKKLENKFSTEGSFNILTSILEDDKGNLWIGSSKGIYKYDRQDQKFIFFNSNHGMPTGRFFIGSAVKTADGKMYFGSNNGIVQFNPDELKTNEKPPSVVFTDFRINNSSNKKSENPGNISIKNINHTETIHLKYNQT
ncbi:MAG: hypothetical protein IH594_03485, partial [Bacteroidales bacterium]|nr:hypothetical protein [Bacteroidales bacterium]